MKHEPVAVQDSPSAGPAVRRAVSRGRRVGLGARSAAAVTGLPDRLPLAFFAVSVVVGAGVLFGVFRPWLVLPVAAASVVATWRWVPSRFPVAGRGFAGSMAAVVLSLAWFVAQLPVVSQYVVVSRDPGFLTLEGLWLRTHASPDLPLDAATRLAAQVPGVSAGMQAYTPSGDVIQVQAQKLVPGLLASVGWLLGERGVLLGGLVIGVVALLTLYGFGRRMVGPLWALVPVAALVLSVPWAAFTRSAYTEPTTIVLVFGGLTVAWSALERRSAGRLALAGAMVGAAALARVDSTAQVVGLVLALGLASACAWDLTGDRWLLRGWAFATLAGTVGVAVGLVDLAWHSASYLDEHSSQTASLDAVLVVAIAGAAAVHVPLLRRWGRARLLWHRRGLATVTVVVVVAVAAFLISRPWWLVERHGTVGVGAATVVEVWQAHAGKAVDPARTYDEMSVTWLSWYYGWAAVLLGFGGIALAGYRAVARRDARLLTFLGVVMAPSAMYLWRVSITPDQVWAMRRFLPVTIPGLLLGATFLLATLWAGRRRWARVVAVAGTVATLVFPLFTWGSLYGVREQGGRLDEARAVCAAVGDRPVVLVAPRLPYLATIRTLCDTQVVSVDAPSRATLAELRRRLGDDTAVVVMNKGEVAWDGTEPMPVSQTRVTQWAQNLYRRPSAGWSAWSVVEVGSVQPDGSVAPLSQVSRVDQG
ncbi:hypothetical protein [Luteimicrobium subarcticum]|uniref:Dolichyl-phosphate-mannose-protein mannosyltransferase n=1 Tax=Luteimicrobium subarcticum TaxID=620910 RepID=A0A2M8WR39_9MICO|nr:hypothetical protein [Luteimicrobium subarcticum]PJI93410.1 hypothetical protein CLV34_1981 [Luteimicrobium subarcticum]